MQPLITYSYTQTRLPPNFVVHQCELFYWVIGYICGSVCDSSLSILSMPIASLTVVCSWSRPALSLTKNKHITEIWRTNSCLRPIKWSAFLPDPCHVVYLVSTGCSEYRPLPDILFLILTLLLMLKPLLLYQSFSSDQVPGPLIGQRTRLRSAGSTWQRCATHAPSIITSDGFPLFSLGP